MAATSSSFEIKRDPLYEKLSACRVDLEDDRRGMYNSLVQTADSHLKDLFKSFLNTSEAIQKEIDNLNPDQDADRIQLSKKLFIVCTNSYHEVYDHLTGTARALTLVENPNASLEQMAFRLDRVSELNQPEIKSSYLTFIRNKTINVAQIITKLTDEKVRELLPLIIQSQHLVEVQKTGGFHFGNPRDKGYQVSKEYTSAQSGVKYYEITTADKTKTSAVFPDSIPDLDTLINLVQNSSTIARSANQRLSKIELKDSAIYIVSYEQGIRMTSVFPVFYFYEYASENKESISFIEGSDKQYSSEELGHAAIKVILDFSDEVARIEAEKEVQETAIRDEKKAIKNQIDEINLRMKKRTEMTSKKDVSIVKSRSAIFENYFDKPKKAKLEVMHRSLDGKISPINEKKATLLKDNPVHFCDDKYVYVDLAVSWQSNSEEPYQSRISGEIDIHHGIMLRISLTDPILQSDDIQSAISKLRSLH